METTTAEKRSRAIPDIEEADMATSPVTSEEMQAAMDALAVEELPTAVPEELPGFSEVTEMPERHSEIAEQQVETDRQALEGIRSQLDQAAIAAPETQMKGMREIPPGAAEYDGDPEKRKVKMYGVSIERPHGDDVSMFRKAFGAGFFGLLNLFNPWAWKDYGKMKKEHDDPALAKKTYYGSSPQEAEDAKRMRMGEKM